MTTRSAQLNPPPSVPEKDSADYSIAIGLACTVLTDTGWHTVRTDRKARWGAASSRVFVAGDRQDATAAGQLAVPEGLEQRGHELAPGQVAGAAEEDEIKCHGVGRAKTLLVVELGDRGSPLGHETLFHAHHAYLSFCRQSDALEYALKSALEIGTIQMSGLGRAA